jgi:hypothetical protein
MNGSPAQIERDQRAFCRGRLTEYVASPGGSKIGLATSTKGQSPLNGLRHPPQGDTNGWYLWFGEKFENTPDFFQPLHTAHVYHEFPQVIPLLGLPPGYRFLLSGSYLDVWHDPSLLAI